MIKISSRSAFSASSTCSRANMVGWLQSRARSFDPDGHRERDHEHPHCEIFHLHIGGTVIQLAVAKGQDALFGTIDPLACAFSSLFSTLSTSCKRFGY